MSRIKNSTAAASALMCSLLALASVVARADDAKAPRCSEPSLSSWFDTQRQLTDGHADPYAAAQARCEKKSAVVESRERAAPRAVVQPGEHGEASEPKLALR
jgi:hypothetical protein